MSFIRRDLMWSSNRNSEKTTNLRHRNWYVKLTCLAGQSEIQVQFGGNIKRDTDRCVHDTGAVRPDAVGDVIDIDCVCPPQHQSITQCHCCQNRWRDALRCFWSNARSTKICVFML